MFALLGERLIGPREPDVMGLFFFAFGVIGIYFIIMHFLKKNSD